MSKLLEEMQAHIASPEFLAYVEQFPDAYDAAVRTTFVSIDEPGSNATQLGKFYQVMWEELPDNPNIRHGAFFKICDFAEQYCFPGEDEG